MFTLVYFSPPFPGCKARGKVVSKKEHRYLLVEHTLSFCFMERYVGANQVGKYACLTVSNPGQVPSAPSACAPANKTLRAHL